MNEACESLMDSSLEGKILNLEKELLKKEVRISAEKVEQLLHEEFVEFCSSGVIYKYKQGDVFEENDNSYNLDIIDLSVIPLSDLCILATYKLVKTEKIDCELKYSLRSSIWKYVDDKWKMVFHQGTLIK